MKKPFKKATALICAAMLTCSLAACGEKTETNETTATTAAATESVTTTAAEQATTAAVTEAVTDATTEAAKADASDSDIVGSWEYEGGGFTYTFNDDGTGVYDLVGSQMKFTYTAENGVLAITYEGADAPIELEYELSGDTLNVKDSMGSDTIYKRK